MQSGSAIPPIYVGVTDKYGQVVGTATNTKLTISVDPSTVNATAQKYSPDLAGTTDYYSTMGVYTVNNLQFTGTPGADYKLKFDSDAIDPTKPANVAAAAAVAGSKTPGTTASNIAS